MTVALQCGCRGKETARTQPAAGGRSTSEEKGVELSPEAYVGIRGRALRLPWPSKGDGLRAAAFVRTEGEAGLPAGTGDESSGQITQPLALPAKESELCPTNGGDHRRILRE